MPAVSVEVLLRSFSRSAVQRGLGIADRVIQAALCDDGSLSGVTRGSSGEVYEQSIQLATNGKIRASCTCPVERNCKHCVAVIRKLGRLPRPVDRVEPLYEDEGGAKVLLDNPLLDTATKNWLRKVKDAVTQKPPTTPVQPTQTILFLLSESVPGYSMHRLFVNVVSVKHLKGGGFGVAKPFRMYQALAGQFPDFLSPDEAVLLTLLYRSCQRVGYTDSVFEIAGLESDRVLGMILDTGKCRWESATGLVLKQGQPRQISFEWQSNAHGVQRLALNPEPKAELIRTNPPSYVDMASGELGPVHAPYSSEAIAALMEAPEVRVETAETVRTALQRSFPKDPELWPSQIDTPETVLRQPTPVLVVQERPAIELSDSSGRVEQPRRFPTLHLSFEYGGQRIDFDDPRPKLLIDDGGQILAYRRDTRFEVAADTRLHSLSLVRGAGRNTHVVVSNGHEDDFTVPLGGQPDTDIVRRDLTFDFLRDHRGRLEAEGWKVEVSDDLHLDLATPEFHIDMQESGTDWFSMSLGFEVEGQRYDLLPILVDAIRRLKMGRAPSEGEADAPKAFYHRLTDGRFVAVPYERIAPLVDTLFEWYGVDGPRKGALNINRTRAADLAELESAAAGFLWEGTDRLRKLGKELAEAGSLPPLAAPKLLKGSLRPYQEQGVAWLQLLRRHDLGAMLADDMGLGKTIQTISHILIEKQEKRLKAPVLIVAPTSTLPNWHAELERFAPSLRVVYAQGANRHKALTSLDGADVVLSTYPLLARDREILRKTPFHMLVLDEAQYIKNSKTNAWQAAKQIGARHRICLTGTPMENHLGELWSLYEFLMPGFLGRSEDFKRQFRTPIEQHQSREAADRLARKVRPFLLRRTKEGVATELPAKTEVLERVDLEGPQRDLYESIRLAMSKRVRDAIASQGLARSQIVVLDALLKLRQACCDPRLLKAEAARDVEGSAKLDRLSELLEELVSEGRQTLVFSQFTSMLALIEERLRQMGIGYVTLTGDTKDRRTPVQQFQKGEVPVFLISLKAGGTGLNLTAAETVIHYDPWWNPAVERQATDRAHRIGQTKPVFVHKLVATDTVEERILELQSKKADLANALLEGGENRAFALAPDDVDLFFGA